VIKVFAFKGEIEEGLAVIVGVVWHGVTPFGAEEKLSPKANTIGSGEEPPRMHG
jgi:hypothetical protein